MTNLSSEYDVVIIGAGPAGSMLAGRLAQAGARVIVLDQSVFPRPKPCGGGLSEKAVMLLDPALDLPAILEDRCSAVQGTWLGQRPFQHAEDRAIVSTMRREVFDHALLRLARSRGAEVREGARVKRVEVESREVRAFASGESFRARFIVGADGWNSVVARGLGLRRDKRLGRVVVGVIAPREPAELDRFRGAVSFDFGLAPHGYAWTFPKRDHLNVGIYTQRFRFRGLGGLFRTYLAQRFPERSADELAQVQAKSCVLPLGGRREPFHAGRALLAGDAAGLVDPFTGEGIYYALRSGQLAAECLLEALRHDTPAPLGDYTRRVQQEMLGNFQASRWVSRIYYLFPALAYRLVTQPQIVAGYQRVKLQHSQRGETPYRQLLRSFLTGGFLRRPPRDPDASK